MLATVIGARRVDFTAPDGEQIKGTKVFISYPAPDDKNLQGDIADSVFITDNSGIAVPVFKFGEKYDFVYETSGIGAKAKARLTKILTANGKAVSSASFSDILP